MSEKSKRKGKPFSANEKPTLRLLIVLTVTASLILLSVFSVYFSNQNDNPFEMTSTAISLTNDYGCILITFTPATNQPVALTPRYGCYSHYELQWLTQTAEAARR
jgi:hypothetical protein